MQESNISSNHLIQVCAFDFNARNGKHKKKKKNKDPVTSYGRMMTAMYIVWTVSF